MPLRVRPADEALGGHVLGDQRHRLLVVGRGGELLAELTGQRVGGPEAVGELACLRFLLAPADLRAGVGRLVAATRGPEERDQLGIGCNISIRFSGVPSPTFLCAWGTDESEAYSLVHSLVFLSSGL
jgi:hypothetical protein